MYLIYSPATKGFTIKESIDGLVFGNDEHIEIHGDNGRGRVYEKPAGIAMTAAISEVAILAEVGIMVEGSLGVIP